MTEGGLAIRKIDPSMPDAQAPDSPRALYESARPVVFDVLLRRLGNLEEAENLCQEALVRALQAHAAGKVDRFAPYAMRIALNLANDLHRRSRFRGELPDLETALRTEEEGGRAEHARLRRAVDQLPEPLRVVIELRYDRELSFAEIARELDMSKNAVFARHNRALDELRAAFARRRE